MWFTSSDIRVTRSNLQVLSSNPRVTSSNLRVTSSNLQVTSSNPRVTTSNPWVRGQKARAARLNTQVGRLKAQIEAIKPRIQNIKFYGLQKILTFFICAKFPAQRLVNLGLIRSNLEVFIFPPPYGLENPYMIMILPSYFSGWETWKQWFK